METQAVINIEWAVGALSDGSDPDGCSAPPIAFLLVPGDGDIKETPLFVGDNFVGRGSNADVILNDGTVSESHAIVTIVNDEVTVKDLKSRYT